MIRTEPVTPDIGRPYSRALSDLDALAIVENGPDSPGPEHDWSVQLLNSYRFILYISRLAAAPEWEDVSNRLEKAVTHA